MALPWRMTSEDYAAKLFNPHRALEAQNDISRRKRTPFEYVEVTEQKRLNAAREKSIPWKKWGSLPERAAMGHGSRGL